MGTPVNFVIKLNLQIAEVYCYFIVKQHDSILSRSVTTRIKLTTEQGIGVTPASPCPPSTEYGERCELPAESGNPAVRHLSSILDA